MIGTVCGGPFGAVYAENLAYVDFTYFHPSPNLRMPYWKLRTFDAIFEPFANPPIRCFPNFLFSLTYLSEEIRSNLYLHFLKIEQEQLGQSTRKVRKYLTILFNILYRSTIRPNHLRVELSETAMRKVLATFEEGCPFHQISLLRSIIIETISEDPDLASTTRASSPLEFYLSICLQQYQKDLISEEIHNHAPTHLAQVLAARDPLTIKYSGLEQMLLSGRLSTRLQELYPDFAPLETFSLNDFAVHFGEYLAQDGVLGIALLLELVGEEAKAIELDSIGADIRKESVEMEFVVMKKLGLACDPFEPHFYEKDLTADAIARDVYFRYQPEQFFVTQLTERDVHPSLRKFHAEIGKWYRAIGLDPYADANRPLLIHPDATEYELWFNEKAILFCFERSGLFM